MAKKILSTLLCVALILSSIVLVAAADTSKSATGDTKYTTASQTLDEQYGYDGDDLGATYTKEATTFKVWSPLATAVKVNLYATGSDSEQGAKKLGTTALQKVMDGDNFTGVWSATLSGDHVDEYYTYSITTPDVTGADSKTYETQDIYSKAAGVNGNRSMIVDLSKTNPDGWESDKHVLLDKATESYVWEVHVKDFSYDTKSGVSEANRGKYLAFTETGTTLNNEGDISTCIDYLKKSGITTVQIQPFYDYGSVDEAGSSAQFNWGYDPKNYNVPEGSYSSNPYDGNVRIKEAKAMIKALHDAGLSVVMDVVYNHTYSTDSCFTSTLPKYYYRMDAKGNYSNGSGCGNDTASERRMYRNFMIQSCLYWANEYHIDGFRFDLMGLHDKETMEMIRTELDKVDSRITMWGEGWSMNSVYPSKTWNGNTLRPCLQSTAGSLKTGIGFFSDKERDALKGSVFQKTARGWLQGSTGSSNPVMVGMQAKCLTYNYRLPSQVVTYAACHDNQTLWDRFAASQELNDYFRKRHPVLVAQNKLAAATMNMSQGITFILAGEEFGRSKDNDADSYKSPAPLNMIDWSLVTSNADIASYYTGMRKIRTHFSPLSDDTRNSDSNVSFKDIPTKDTSKTNNGFVATWTNSTSGEWSKLVAIFNNTENEVNYTLSDSVKDWAVIADSEKAGVKQLYEVKDNKFTLPAYSAIIAVDKSSYDAVAISDNTGAVNVKAIDTVAKKTVESYSITGEIGDSYQLVKPSSLGKEYDLINIEGNMKGTFADGDQNVTMNYGYYVPESVKADVTGDGKVDINDVTAIQLALVKKTTLTDAQKKTADATIDGKVNINDATMIQNYLADKSVGLGQVVVNHYDKATGKKVAKASTFTERVGDKFTAEPITRLGYKLSEGSEVTTINVPYGRVEINYYYDSLGTDVTLHIKHSSGSGYDPTIWIWGNCEGDETENYNDRYNKWPGDMFTTKDANGWYNKTYEVDKYDDSFNIIISKCTGTYSNPVLVMQSADCRDIIYNEIWAVIDDTRDDVSFNVYNVNPDTNPGAEPVAHV